MPCCVRLARPPRRHHLFAGPIGTTLIEECKPIEPFNVSHLVILYEAHRGAEERAVTITVTMLISMVHDLVLVH